MATVYPYLGGTPSKAKFDNNSGEALSGGKVYFYVAGTSTPKDTYSESTGTTLNANPVILDSRGEANIFLLGDQAYKVVVKDSSDVTIYTVDNVWAPAGTNGLLSLTKFLGSMGVPVNFSLSASVAASALTMAVKTESGSDATASNPIYVPFRSSTASSGSIVWRTVTAALSLTISSGSTLGHNSALKQYIYWYLLDNSGTVELAASFKYFGQHGIVSTTAEGGAGAADSGTVMYSSTARTNVPFICVGYTEDTQTTAGTWATAPSAVHLAPFTLPVISFSAHKNATNQTGVTTSTEVPITFGTEVYDNGALFASSIWTPPPGLVSIDASIAYTVTVDQTSYLLILYKNGTNYKNSEDQSSGVSKLGLKMSMTDECSGSDTYQVAAFHTAGSDRTISGSTADTWFMGSWSPGRS